DSKLLRTSNSSKAEDMLAVLVTGEEISKLLTILIIDGSLDIYQETAIYSGILPIEFGLCALTRLQYTQDYMKELLLI
ncbi:hypothetical protein HHI36_013086, partial [Cryptolaemus montrouzieri]